MCLDKVTKTYEEIESKQVMVGYKAFIERNNDYFPWFVSGQTPYEFETWKESTQKTIATRILAAVTCDKNQIVFKELARYQSGFHFFLNEEACYRYICKQYNRYAASKLNLNNLRLGILKCKFTGLICEGKDEEERVIVAKQMWIFDPSKPETEPEHENTNISQYESSSVLDNEYDIMPSKFTAIL